jgi:hypothetical protein
MANTAVESGPRLIAFVLPSIPESVPVARLHVRVALGFHGLGEYLPDSSSASGRPDRCGDVFTGPWLSTLMHQINGRCTTAMAQKVQTIPHR